MGVRDRPGSPGVRLGPLVPVAALPPVPGPDGEHGQAPGMEVAGTRSPLTGVKRVARAPADSGHNPRGSRICGRAYLYPGP